VRKLSPNTGADQNDLDRSRTSPSSSAVKGVSGGWASKILETPGNCWSSLPPPDRPPICSVPASQSLF
jgi:hypothetical protein